MMLQILIENSIKHGLEPKIEGGRIEISARTVDRELWVDVEDNGVGFDPDFAIVAFNPLARGIHTAGEGTGIGLATCRTIIQSHGGQIRIDPQWRNGARVEFTLPDKVKPAHES